MVGPSTNNGEAKKSGKNCSGLSGKRDEGFSLHSRKILADTPVWEKGTDRAALGDMDGAIIRMSAAQDTCRCQLPDAPQLDNGHFGKLETSK